MSGRPRASALVELPTHRVVRLEHRAGELPRARERRAPLFSEALEIFADGTCSIAEKGQPVLVKGLALCDFHALRAIATHLGWLVEATVDITCRNCGVPIAASPCADLALGPFEERALSDPELDVTLDLTEPHEIPAVRLAAGRRARTIVLREVTVGEASPLHRALCRRRLVLGPSVVRAMGILRLGGEERPERIARALEDASEEAWTAISQLFLEAHYPPRLSSIARCATCGARNDVDAPYDREFEPAYATVDGAKLTSFDAHSIAETDAVPAPFPTFEAFAEEARRVGAELLGQRHDDVAFVVEGGVPACDEGGEPLLGSYLPPYEGDYAHPTRPPEITLFYRTFRAMHEEDGPYDWRAELTETVAHELEHHLAHLGGHDPVADEERREIDREAKRVLGETAIVKGSARALGRDFLGFLRITWPIWLVLAIVTVVMAARNG